MAQEKGADSSSGGNSFPPEIKRKTIHVPVDAVLGDFFALADSSGDIFFSFTDFRGCKGAFPVRELRLVRGIEIDMSHKPDRRAAGACRDYGAQFTIRLGVGPQKPFPALPVLGVSYPVSVYGTHVGDLVIDPKGNPKFNFKD